MRAILLCAGFATRLYPLTKNFPKPLLPVADRPVLDYLMDQLMGLPGLREIHLVSNDRFYAKFEEWAGTWRENPAMSGIRLEVHNDGAASPESRLGAVADLHFAVSRLGADTPTLVAAGDNIFRFSLRPIWERFRQRGENLVAALHESRRDRLQRTAVLELAAGDRVLRLLEKPQDPPTAWSCPALYFLQPEALRLLPEYLRRPDAEDAPGHFLAFAVQRVPVYAIRVEGSRLDIGNLETYREADALLRREPVLPGPQAESDDETDEREAGPGNP